MRTMPSRTQGSSGPRTRTRTVTTLTTNSNDPTKNTSTTTKERVAAGTPAGGSNRFADKPADHWSNAQYGARFGRGDIGRLQDRGYNSNQIMKIAQMAYAGGAGNINKINKTNQALYDMSTNAMKVGQNTMMRQGQASTNYYLPGRGGSVIGDSPKRLGWNGFGDSMSINRYGGGDSYKQTGVWSLPSAYRTGGAATGGGTTAGGGASDGAGTGTGAGEVLPNDYQPTAEAVTADQQDPIGMMSGGGAGINSATGLRRKKSSWKSAGTSTKGSSALNRGLTINSFNV